jgi:hypothetical protein
MQIREFQIRFAACVMLFGLSGRTVIRYSRGDNEDQGSSKKAEDERSSKRTSQRGHKADNADVRHQLFDHDNSELIKVG